MQEKNETKEILGLNRITKKRIMELCKKDKLYQTPELNDVLYLHYQGFEYIECLEDYTELKCLWLECNAISEIQGLEKQAKLKCLFLQNNLIRKIENLDYCKELDTVNLSQNHIRKIENCGFEVLPVLNTLNLSSNYLKDCEGLKELENCKNLSVLDLSNNRIDDILVVKIFGKMPELKVLVLQGNPVVSKIPQYRKTLILECKQLTYLDSRPVFPKDRACAEAWKRGGYEEERKENERWNRRERKKMRDGVNATIQLRNRNRKPEDQISLIPSSSDSEDELKNTEKKNLQNQVQSEVGIDSMWDEVSQDKHSERSSSSVTSCESKISDSSQSCESNNDGEQEKEIDERLMSDDKQSIEFSGSDNEVERKLNESEKILEIEKLKNSSLVASLKPNKDSLDQNQSTLETKLENLIVPASENVQLQIKNYEVLENCSEICTPLDPQESKLDKPRSDHFRNVKIPIEFSKGLENSSENSDSIPLPCSSEIIESKEPEINHLGNIVKHNETISEKNVQLHIKNFEELQNSNDYDVAKDSSKNYQTTIEAIRNITKADDLSDSSSNKNDEITNKIEEHNEDYYEPLQEMEDAMNILNHYQSEEQSISKDNLKKSQIQMETEQERLKVNQQLKTDFEELSTNLSNFIEQLDLEQKERQEVFKALYNTNLAPKESSAESSGSEEKDHLEKWKLDRMIDQWDKESKLRNDPTEIKLNAEEQVEEMSKAEKEEILRDSFQSISTNDIKLGEDLKDSLENVPGNIIKIDETLQNEKITQITADKVNSSTFLSEKCDYIPMDISLLTRKSNEALNSLERESKELKRLLQQLEDKNEDLFKDINAEIKCEREENNMEKQSDEDGYYERKRNRIEKEGEEAANDISFKEDDYKTNDEELKSDQFEQNLDKREETSEGERGQYDQSLIVQTIVEELLKSLELKQKSYKFPETFEGLKELPTKVQSLQQTHSSSLPEFVKSFNQFYENIETKNLEKIKHSDDKEKQKSSVLKQLAKETNLKQFNNDSLESLDAQLAEMVDRVYAQKDRYNDTLELVEGKLMVRHQDTQELSELPQPVQQDSTDSEADYDTAQSDEEENIHDCCSKIEKGVKRKPYKPIARKSSEDLIIQALIANKSNKASDESEESNDDEFYSLDNQDPANLYKEIDKEFFNKLTLENLKLSHVDENHIVQCARSYEELKHCLTLSKEERCLTEEENELLENMIERKCVKLNENPETLRDTLQNKRDLTSEEQLWLKKMSIKTEEMEAEKSVKDQLELKSSQEAIQLYAYKHGNTEIESNTMQQLREKSSRDSMLKDSEPIGATSEDVTEHLMKKILLKKLAEQKKILPKETLLKSEKPQFNKSHHESALSYDRQSEEEKNEIESNIDFESEASNKKGKQVLKKEKVKIEIADAADELIPNECLLNDGDDNDVVEGNSAGVEILECNLEIIDCNDELVDTITVNAEVHF